MPQETTVPRTCPFCEATCGLDVTVSDGKVTRVRGDSDDVFSKGFLCPKGVSLKELHEDQDRLQTPMIRGDDGVHRPATWDEEFAHIDAHLPAIMAEHGRDTVATYLGNPSAHGLAPIIYGRVLLKGIGSKNVYSASSVDQIPKQLSSALMFGTGLSVPIPDLDRTDHLLVLGANPLASNGSLMTAPDVRGRLQAIQKRGGRVVVIDPRRTRTAQAADEHQFIRPGTDPLLLFALIHVIFEEGLDDLGPAGMWIDGVDTVRALATDFSPELVAEPTGIAAEDIRRLARELAAAPTAAVYGRIGTTTQPFGTVASWLIDVLNAITGNLDRPGGAMFTRAAAGASNTKGEPGRGRPTKTGRWTSRVRGLPEVFGELPVATMVDEMTTPGEGQVRALITIAGNPALSTPNSDRLEAALEGLDYMVSVDIYLNETSRHADVVLPSPSPLEKGHYDLALYAFAIRNIANYSPPVLPLPEGMRDEWRSLLRLTGIVTGQGADVDVDAVDAFVAAEMVRRECSDDHSPIHGRDPDEIMAALAPRVGPERILDLMLRCGPYGDGFGAGEGSLSMDELEANPHGVDCGALEPRLPEVLRTGSGRVELAPEAIVADVARLHDVLMPTQRDEEAMVLVGRRDLRSNNSWMHNLPLLVSGPARCTVQVHPDDADRLGLLDGETARVQARTGAIELPVQVTPDVMPGVVSIPHGWGHGGSADTMQVAGEHAGVNSNVLADELIVDALTGNAVLNGIPVELTAVRADAPVAA